MDNGNILQFPDFSANVFSIGEWPKDPDSGIMLDACTVFSSLFLKMECALRERNVEESKKVTAALKEVAVALMAFDAENTSRPYVYLENVTADYLSEEDPNDMMIYMLSHISDEEDE